MSFDEHHCWKRVLRLYCLPGDVPMGLLAAVCLRLLEEELT